MIYSDALRLEVNRIDPNDPNRRKINALAEKLVSCALTGESWAFKEIGDRLEGKPLPRRLKNFCLGSEGIR
jgi:hypothetical protein